MPEYLQIKAPQQVANPADAEAFEAKHSPHIEVALIDGVAHVTVQTGFYAPHPNEPGHYFDWLELCVAGQPVARFDATGGITAPYLATQLNLEPGTELTALAHCNLHGTWRADASITA